MAFESAPLAALLSLSSLSGFSWEPARPNLALYIDCIRSLPLGPVLTCSAGAARGISWRDSHIAAFCTGHGVACVSIVALGVVYACCY